MGNRSLWLVEGSYAYMYTELLILTIVTVNFLYVGVCKIYEEHLKKRNPNTPTITYDISQLFDFVDQLTDISCLVYQKSTNTYAPYNKEWIKEKIYVLLRRAAGHSE